MTEPRIFTDTRIHDSSVFNPWLKTLPANCERFVFTKA